ncbi:hypothetical protein H1R20_g1167, partial [Candolleomyces eurysporus]
MLLEDNSTLHPTIQPPQRVITSERLHANQRSALLHLNHLLMTQLPQRAASHACHKGIQSERPCAKLRSILLRKHTPLNVHSIIQRGPSQETPQIKRKRMLLHMRNLLNVRPQIQPWQRVIMDYVSVPPNPKKMSRMPTVNTTQPRPSASRVTSGAVKATPHVEAPPKTTGSSMRLQQAVPQLTPVRDLFSDTWLKFTHYRGMDGHSQDSDEEPQRPATKFSRPRHVTISSMRRSIDRVESDFDDMYSSGSGKLSDGEVRDVFESTPVHSTPPPAFKIKSAFGSSTSSAFENTQHLNTSPTLGKAPPQLVPREATPTAFEGFPEDSHDPLGTYALSKLERKWGLPTFLVCRANECNPTGPFTPETTPTHHLYTYRFPADVGATIPPPPDEEGFGHIIACGPGHRLVGVEKGVAYWHESRNYWIRLPWKSHYIPEAERLDPQDAYQLTMDAAMLNSFLTDLHRHYGITDQPTAHNYAHKHLPAGKGGASSISSRLPISKIFSQLKPSNAVKIEPNLEPIRPHARNSSALQSGSTTKALPFVPQRTRPSEIPQNATIHVVEDSDDDQTTSHCSQSAIADGVSTPSGSDFQASFIETNVDTLCRLHGTLDDIRGARANARRVLAECGASMEAVEKGGNAVKVSAQDREKLKVIGKELHAIVNKTGLPVHMLLQYTGLLIQWTRGQNSWNLYQEFVRTQDRKIPFETFGAVVKPEYDEMKRQSSSQQWNKLKETWRNAITKEWMSKVSTTKRSASHDNAAMVKHMSQIVAQFSELQGKIRNGAPIEMITLVYLSDPHMRQLSQFLVSDPNLRPLFKSQ